MFRAYERDDPPASEHVGHLREFWPVLEHDEPAGVLGGRCADDDNACSVEVSVVHERGQLQGPQFDLWLSSLFSRGLGSATGNPPEFRGTATSVQ